MITFVIAAVAAPATQQTPPVPPTAAESALAEQIVAATSAAERQRLMASSGTALTSGVPRAISAKALELRRAGKSDEATALYRIVREVTEYRHDRVALANSLISYSAIPGQRAEYAEALAALTEALGIGEELKNDDVISGALANLAIVYRLTGDFDRALETNQRALALAVRSGDRYTQGRVLSNIGLVYAGQGRYREALEAYEQSLALKEETQDSDLALTLNNIGIIHADQGNQELALAFYTKALAALEKAGDIQGQGSELGNIGVVYRTMGRLDLARQYFDRALVSYERTGNRRGVATATYNVASVLRREGKMEESLAGFRQSLAMRESMNDVVGVRESLDAIANMLVELGRPMEGLASAERAVAVARELGSNELVWQPLVTLGHILAQTEPARAEAAYRDAIAAVEAVRNEVAGGADSRRRFFEDRLTPYHELTTFLRGRDRGAEALAIAERARGRVLSELLASGDVGARPLSVEERDKQRALEQAVVANARRLSAAERRRTADPVAAKDVQQASDRLKEARVEADAFRDALDARYPVRRLARGGADLDPVASAAELLHDAHAAIVEFVVSDMETDIFVVAGAAADAPDRSPTISTFAVAINASQLEARVQAYRQKLASRSPGFQAEARALYDLLLKPASAVLAGRTRLVIVPDAVLWTIPFETLAPAADRALIDQAAVTYAPSIALLRDMHQRRAALESSGGPPRIMIAADPASDLPKLPEAQLQATALTAIYGASRSRVFVGTAATEPRVRAAAANATILHFATHGVVDDTNPMYSYLQLARSSRVDANADGRLEAWEILSLKLDATVAVLTACDTARGTLGGGEGVVGLAWAFFAAGTPATVVSLWQLDSPSATSLTLGLHQRLRAAMLRGHASVGDSLRAAALELRRDPRYRHPYYWAGLVAVGDGY